MSYELQIPKETLYKFKDKCFLSGYSTTASTGYKLAQYKGLILSGEIELKENDICYFTIPIDYYDKIRSEYTELGYQIPLGSIKALVTKGSGGIDDNGVVVSSVSRGTVSPINSNGELTSYATEKTFFASNYEKFISTDCVYYYRDCNTFLEQGYTYIYLPQFYIDGYQQTSSLCGIIRDGDNPYGNWNETQNSLAFKHYLQQSHLKHKGGK